MLSFRLRALCASGMLLLALGVMVSSASAGEPLADMIKRVPGTANSIVVMDVKAMYESPLGRQKGWKNRREVFGENTEVLPHDVNMIVMGSNLDLNDPKNSWTIGLVDLDRVVTTKQLVTKQRGLSDQLAGRDVVWSPRNAYFTMIKPTLLGRYSPANRQDFAKWLKHEKQAVISGLSSYLQRATNDIARGTPMVLAMDLEDALLPASVRAFLKDSPSLTSGSDLDRLTKILSSLKGLKMDITVGEADLNGTLTLEFGEAVAPLGSMAKLLVVEAFKKLGAELEDLPKWDAVSVGTTIVMKGRLGKSSMLRIMSLFDVPTDSQLDPDATGNTPTSPQSQAEATKKYYRSVRTVLDDLKAQKATSQGGLALWYGRYARKIDQLPVLDVDPEILSYGQWISESLRGVSTAYEGVSAGTGYRKSMTSGYYGGGNREAGDRIRRQENIYAEKVNRDTWDAIENRSSALRKSMTVKYRVEF